MKERFDINKIHVNVFLYLVNSLVLSVHVILIVFFALTHVGFMAAVNVGSITMYVFLFLLIRAKRARLYISLAVLEIIVHMCLAIACVGLDCGFQYYFFACMGVVFYTDYFFSRENLKRSNVIPFCILCAAAFCACFVIFRSREPIYGLSDGAAAGMTIFNVLAVFLFTAICLWLLITKANYYEDELARQANHDRLTGLVNRNYILEYLQNIYASGDMSDYWLAIIDIDDFKKINDTYGHNCGDYVLKTVSEIISENSCGMTPCRWGGEEFILVGRVAERRQEVPGSARFVMERVRGAVEKYNFCYYGKDIRMTITIGLAVHNEQQGIDEWVNAADEKLYRGKQTGKNKLVV